MKTSVAEVLPCLRLRGLVGVRVHRVRVLHSEHPHREMTTGSSGSSSAPAPKEMISDSVSCPDCTLPMTCGHSCQP